MRTVLAVVVSFLLTNAIPGWDATRDIVPAPTTISCQFDVRQPTEQYEYAVQPVERAHDVVAFYDYRSDSAHTPFVEAYASVLFLYLDTRTGNLYLVFHFNIDQGGTPNAEAIVAIEGIPPGASVVLSDDPGEFSIDRNPQGHFHYFSNTDGGVLGPLPADGQWAMNLDMSHVGGSALLAQYWIDADGTRLPFELHGRIVLESSCNRAPTAILGGPYSGFEGSPITFDAGGSSDPDGDALTYTWDFEDDGTPDATTTSPTVEHIYPDDFAGRAKLTVSDGAATASATATVTVANVAPVVVIDSLAATTEGAGTILQLHVTDPGADTVVVEFDQGDTRGPYVIGQVFNPKDYPITTPVTWGDDGMFPVVATATDDDQAVGQAGAIADITNEIPGITAVTNPSATTYSEGDEADVELRARDNGSDDLRIDVDFGNGDMQTSVLFNDGVGPDPDPSPLGTYPFEASAKFSTRYVDDGAYTMRITATDDDGGSATLAFAITVLNVAPTIQPFDPGSSVEGSPGALVATATDPGNDALTFAWEFELAPSFSEFFPASGSPMTATSTVNFLYGDDGSYGVRLTVADDDGGVAVFETTVEVANLAPSAAITQVSRTGSFVLRVAGEKWHDVRAIFYRDAAVLEGVGVVRSPGSPDDQAVGTAVYDLALASRFTATILYTPEDDPVNGQPNGANPVWILLLADDGTEVTRVHHTFNVEHPGTYTWDVDLTLQVAALSVRFAASATDAGSDDLTFAWDFGDGSAVASSIAYNDGAGPDPSKSPGGMFPFTATEEVPHTFPSPGTYTVTLTLRDDDGGIAVTSVTITIAG